jgi:hypothetical protein
MREMKSRKKKPSPFASQEYRNVKIVGEYQNRKRLRIELLRANGASGREECEETCWDFSLLLNGKVEDSFIISSLEDRLSRISFFLSCAKTFLTNGKLKLRNIFPFLSYKKNSEDFAIEESDSMLIFFGSKNGDDRDLNVEKNENASCFCFVMCIFLNDATKEEQTLFFKIKTFNANF